jgi:hypothetical protein
MRERRKVMSRTSFRRVVGAAASAVVLASVARAVVETSVARADAPAGDASQYGVFDMNNTTITDNRTHLTWQRAASSTVVTLPVAEGNCAALALGGWATGWRVPSYKELLTLVDESPHPEYDTTTGTLVYKAIDSFAFGFQYTPITPPYYWSSSVSAPDSSAAYLVDFRSGATLMLVMSATNFVRCVHD